MRTPGSRPRTRAPYAGSVLNRRALALPLAAALPLVLGLAAAAPAAAVVRDDGDEPGASITGLEALLLYVGGPVALLVLVTVLVMLPSLTRRGRAEADENGHRSGGEGWRDGGTAQVEPLHR